MIVVAIDVCVAAITVVVVVRGAGVIELVTETSRQNPTRKESCISECETPSLRSRRILESAP